MATDPGDLVFDPPDAGHIAVKIVTATGLEMTSVKQPGAA